jgi:hypothetical protein
LFLSGNFQESFIGLLNLAAIKRDAKAYITPLRDLNKATTDAYSASPKPAGYPVKSLPRPQVNLGNFYSRTRAVEDSPTFSLQKDSAPVVEEDAGKLHVALVKLVHAELLDDWILQTPGQLLRLSISPCVVVDTDTIIGTVGHIWRQKHIDQAELVVAAVDSDSGPGSARVDNFNPLAARLKFILGSPSSSPFGVVRYLLWYTAIN